MKDFFGMYLIVNNNLMMLLYVYNVNIMYKWIKEEEILKEIHKYGGDNIMIKMEK